LHTSHIVIPAGIQKKQRTITKYMDEGEIVDDVVTADYDKYELPSDNVPLKFEGKVFVVAGNVTYFSAILFANTIQDFRFGQIVGEGSAGYSWQTGGIQFFTFPYLSLKAVITQFYLSRTSGKGFGLTVQPNFLMHNNPLNARTFINELVKNYLNDQLATKPNQQGHSNETR
jgi:hypothetical protein